MLKGKPSKSKIDADDINDATDNSDASEGEDDAEKQKRKIMREMGARGGKKSSRKKKTDTAADEPEPTVST